MGWLPQLTQPSIVLHLLRIQACGTDERGRRDLPGWFAEWHGVKTVQTSRRNSGSSGVGRS